MLRVRECELIEAFMPADILRKQDELIPSLDIFIKESYNQLNNPKRFKI
jgi:hypothetical protein